ncbi:YusU family protein [Bacillus sp. SG-1]|uniref:YusU family protein n=1 Tax=Bacillus sp. SG-1 TaxID=161544 RepID=UPI00015450FB|nr:YusU family protein [Bacillus sp. SG-1]EDL62657.1 YusU [Bacillus sp. SG-1]
MTDFDEQFDTLIDKYTELLLGETSPELKEKVTKWVIYSHVAKSMPPLAKHWNSEFPEAKEEIKKIISEIKELNEEHRANKDK